MWYNVLEGKGEGHVVQGTRGKGGMAVSRDVWARGVAGGVYGGRRGRVCN